jgi:ABC-type multidrug transport system fused ATPase/permease subunit
MALPERGGGAERDLSAQDQVGFWSRLPELYYMLSPHRRRQFYLVVALMLAGALAELATIGAIIPFLSLLADPHRLGHVALIAAAFDALGATTDRARLIGATGVFIIFALFAGAVRLQLAWTSQEFVFRLGHDFSVDIQRRLLLQPYTFHIGQNTSTLVAALEKVGVLTFTVIQQIIQAGIAAFIALFIIAVLVVIDPVSAIAAAAGFVVIYLLVSAFTRHRLAQNSEVQGSSYDERVKILQESLGGIRDVIIDGSQSVYLDAFRRVDDRFNAAKASTAFISAAPRFVIEALGMILIAVLAIVISAREGGFALALPILGALALGAQRLLPLLQQIYFGWSLAAGNESLLAQVLALLRLPVDEPVVDPHEAQPLLLGDRICVEQVSFAYASRRAAALEDVSFEIPRGARVALVGKTGSGKSTLADLLMGLLEPGTGRIMIDGVPLTRENRRSWQRSIAHVPQAIFLADASIARNIALGVPAETIDLPRVREAGRKAQLDEFVDTLAEGYDTPVGERGIRLSGGQRQRLAIARAIYKRTPVLVLDEATSALDDETEAAVMHALDQLGEEGRTIIMIAHRITTIARADIVVRLDNGRVVEIRSHSETIDGDPQLRVS